MTVVQSHIYSSDRYEIDVCQKCRGKMKSFYRRWNSKLTLELKTLRFDSRILSCALQHPLRNCFCSQLGDDLHTFIDVKSLSCAKLCLWFWQDYQSCLPVSLDKRCHLTADVQCRSYFAWISLKHPPWFVKPFFKQSLRWKCRKSTITSRTTLSLNYIFDKAVQTAILKPANVPSYTCGGSYCTVPWKTLMLVEKTFYTVQQFSRAGVKKSFTLNARSIYWKKRFQAWR